MVSYLKKCQVLPSSASFQDDNILNATILQLSDDVTKEFSVDLKDPYSEYVLGY